MRIIRTAEDLSDEELLAARDLAENSDGLGADFAIGVAVSVVCEAPLGTLNLAGFCDTFRGRVDRLLLGGRKISA